MTNFETSTFGTDNKQPQRAMASSEVALDWIIGWNTDQTLAVRVAPMFVTDGKPNMQHAEFTEDLRDYGSNCGNHWRRIGLMASLGQFLMSLC